MCKSPILVASSNEDVIVQLERLCRELRLDVACCKTFESFFSSCLLHNFAIGIIDLAIFSEHKLSSFDILKNSLQDMKIVAVTSGIDKSERELIGANLSQRIIYRLVKPFSKNEARLVINALARIVERQSKNTIEKPL